MNILLYHVLMDPSSIGLAIVATILWFLIFIQERAAFRGILQATSAS